MVRPAAIKLNHPIVGMAATPDGKGYWLVASDGGIFAFGDAHFFGSPAAKGVSDWVTGMAVTPDGKGYWIANANGAVYQLRRRRLLRQQPWHGAHRVDRRYHGRPGRKGYWLLEPDAFPTGFTHPGEGAGSCRWPPARFGPDPDPGMFCNPYGPCEEWCALFATWVWEQAGIPIPGYAFVGDVYTGPPHHTAVLPPRPGRRRATWCSTAPGRRTSSPPSTWGWWPRCGGTVPSTPSKATPAPGRTGSTTCHQWAVPASDSLTYNGTGIFAYAVP